ncbi:hypothetical protein Hdeb2414_s0001g00020251 [Helianthus debilis subsp. tardiflorus]
MHTNKDNSLPSPIFSAHNQIQTNTQNLLCLLLPSVPTANPQNSEHTLINKITISPYPTILKKPYTLLPLHKQESVNNHSRIPPSPLGSDLGNRRAAVSGGGGGSRRSDDREGGGATTEREKG